MAPSPQEDVASEFHVSDLWKHRCEALTKVMQPAEAQEERSRSGTHPSLSGRGREPGRREVPKDNSDSYSMSETDSESAGGHIIPVNNAQTLSTPTERTAKGRTAHWTPREGSNALGLDTPKPPRCEQPIAAGVLTTTQSHPTENCSNASHGYRRGVASRRLGSTGIPNGFPKTMGYEPESDSSEPDPDSGNISDKPSVSPANITQAILDDLREILAEARLYENARPSRVTVRGVEAHGFS